METHKVIYDPTQKSNFTGVFFTGSKTDCENYCNNNNGNKGQYFTLITVSTKLPTGQITITTDRKDFDFDVAYNVTESEPRTFDHPGTQRSVEIYFIKYNGRNVQGRLSDKVINEIEHKILET